MQVCVIRSVFIDIIARRTEVVVYHVHDHGQALGVRCIHQALETDRIAIRSVRRKQISPVIAPAMLARKCIDRKQFNVGNAKLFKIAKLLARSVKGALRRKGTYM